MVTDVIAEKAMTVRHVNQDWLRDGAGDYPLLPLEIYLIESGSAV